MSDVPAHRVSVSLSVNGNPVMFEVAARKLLSDFLRDDLELTGTHVGCENGVCGSCTILLDGEAVRSCIMLAAQADGRSITTIEGVTPHDGLGEIQSIFSRNHALQCGFCTAGFIMTLLGTERGQRTEAEIREELSGNLCRCTGYDPIVQSAQEFWEAD